MIAARLTVQAQTSRRLLSNRGLASQLLASPKEEWSFNQLKREARERGINQGGNKAALLARLQADDLTRAGQSEQAISTSASAPAPKAATSSSSQVVEPGDNPVNVTSSLAPARTAFKSSRTLRPYPSDSLAPQIPGIPTSDNPFAPKRSAPLFIAIPHEVDPPEEGPVIPFVPENYGSSPHDSASPPDPLAPADTPKIHAVSGLDEHLAAPAHPTATTVVSPPVQVSSSSSSTATSESWSEKAASYGKTLSSWLPAGTSEESHYAKGDPKAKLTGDEKRGLYVLGGIVFGGWLLGGILKPSAPKEHH